MKIACTSCAIHFPEEFEATLKKPCTFWAEHGFPETFPKKYKKVIWDWVFKLPTDEIALATGTTIETFIRGVDAPKDGNDFVKYVPEYEKWTEPERKKFQKKFQQFANSLSRSDLTGIIMKSFLMLAKPTTKRAN